MVTRVQDIYAEVTELRIRLCSEEKLDIANMSLDDQRQRGRKLIEEGEWMQISVRFVALEDDVLLGDVRGEVGSEGTLVSTETRASTWVFEARVWDIETNAHEHDESDFDAMVKAAMQRRRRNPHLNWRLISIAAAG